MHGVAPNKRAAQSPIIDIASSIYAGGRAVFEQTSSVLDEWWSTKHDAMVL